MAETEMDRLPEEEIKKDCGCIIIIDKFAIAIKECLSHKNKFMFARI